MLSFYRILSFYILFDKLFFFFIIKIFRDLIFLKTLNIFLVEFIFTYGFQIFIFPIFL